MKKARLKGRKDREKHSFLYSNILFCVCDWMHTFLLLYCMTVALFSVFSIPKRHIHIWIDVFLCFLRLSFCVLLAFLLSLFLILTFATWIHHTLSWLHSPINIFFSTFVHFILLYCFAHISHFSLMLFSFPFKVLPYDLTRFSLIFWHTHTPTVKRNENKQNRKRKKTLLFPTEVTFVCKQPLLCEHWTEDTNSKKLFKM